MDVKRIGIVDLFSGSGGLSLGFKNAGFFIVAAVEFEKSAAETYSKNFKNTKLIVDDIKNLKAYDIRKIISNEKFKEIIIIGGPPCQPYSKANKHNNGATHPFASAVSHYFRLISDLKPVAFLFENVTAFRNLPGWEKFLNDFKKIGYTTSVDIVDCENVGIPQKRKRLFVCGFKNGIKCDLSTIRSPISCKSISEAISVLPNISDKAFGKEIMPHPRQYSSKYEKKMIGNTKKLYNHWCTKHGNKVLKTISEIKEGESLLRSWDNLSSKTKMRFKNKKSLHGNIYKRLSFDGVAPTIVHARRAMLLHPKQNRIISVREAARIQSFPDSFRFYGSNDVQYQQVADAVPPLIAEQIALEYSKILNLKGS